MKLFKKRKGDIVIVISILIAFALIIAFSQFTGYMIKHLKPGEEVTGTWEFFLDDLTEPFCAPEGPVRLKGFYLLIGEDFPEEELVKAAGWIQDGFYDVCGKAPTTDVDSLNQKHKMSITRDPHPFAKNIWKIGNAILIGQPCTNKYMAELYDTKACDIANGQGMIEILSSGEHVMVVVTGATIKDIQRAALTLASLDPNELTGKKLYV